MFTSRIGDLTAIHADCIQHLSFCVASLQLLCLVQIFGNHDFKAVLCPACFSASWQFVSESKRFLMFELPRTSILFWTALSVVNQLERKFDTIWFGLFKIQFDAFAIRSVRFFRFLDWMGTSRPLNSAWCWFTSSKRTGKSERTIQICKSFILWM